MKAGKIVIEWNAYGKATFSAPMGSGDDRALAVQMLAQTIVKLVTPQPSVLVTSHPDPLEWR